MVPVFSGSDESKAQNGTSINTAATIAKQHGWRRYNRTKKSVGGDYTSGEAKSQNGTKLNTAATIARCGFG